MTARSADSRLLCGKSEISRLETCVKLKTVMKLSHFHRPDMEDYASPTDGMIDNSNLCKFLFAVLKPQQFLEACPLHDLNMSLVSII